MNAPVPIAQGNARAPYQRHSGTSAAAATSSEPRTGTDSSIVLAFIRGCGHQGATDEQQQAQIPMSGDTQRPRRVSLVSRGLVVDSGARRLTASGKHAAVWVAAEHFEGMPHGG